MQSQVGLPLVFQYNTPTINSGGPAPVHGSTALGHKRNGYSSLRQHQQDFR